MKHITPILLVIFILLTAYNTYKIHTTDTSTKEVSVEMDTDVNAKINANATEIQSLKTNLETMVNFVNAKFENLKSKETSQ